MSRCQKRLWASACEKSRLLRLLCLQMSDYFLLRLRRETAARACELQNLVLDASRLDPHQGLFARMQEKQVVVTALWLAALRANERNISMHTTFAEWTYCFERLTAATHRGTVLAFPWP